MIQELENNEVFSNVYLNVAPKKGDLAAVFEKDGRRLMMALDGEGTMSLPDASLFADFWFDPHDPDADRKAMKAPARKHGDGPFVSVPMFSRTEHGDRHKRTVPMIHP